VRFERPVSVSVRGPGGPKTGPNRTFKHYVQSLVTGSTSAKPFAGTKCKAIVNLSPAPLVLRVVNRVVDDSDDGNETELDGNETEPAGDEDMNDADVSSQSLQAMADADHVVRSLHTFS
jgi:hypothetical protein